MELTAPRLSSFYTRLFRQPPGCCYHIFLMLRFETAGESHGECLVATLTGLPAGIPVSLERDRPRVVAPPAGLWTRRANEDRNRPCAHRQRGAAFENHRVAHRDHPRKQGLEELDRRSAGGRHRRRGGQEKAGHASAPRPCGFGGRDQIQFSGCAIHSGTGERPGNDGSRRGRGAGEGVSGRIRHRRVEPRDRRRRSEAGSRRVVGRTGGVEQARRGSAELRRPRGRAAHESRGRSSVSDRGHRWRGVRSGRAWRADGTGVACHLGSRGWTENSRRRSFRCRR